MKKIGRFPDPYSKASEKNNIEYLNEYVKDNPEWRKYFTGFINHNDSIRSMDNNMMYVYCSFRERLRPYIIENVQLPKFTENICWDSMHNFYYADHDEPGSEPVITFSCTSRKNVGVYFIKRNTLCLVDLTHYHNQSINDNINFMINYLKEKGYFDKKIKIKRSKKVEAIPIPGAKISIGADPEFEISIDGEIVYGADVAEFCSDDDGDACSKEWGLDGSSQTVEARPEPAFTPQEAVENMKSLFERVTEYDLTTASRRYSAGGHIHIGGITFDYKLDRGLLHLLDKQIGEPTITMNGKARISSSYLCMSAYETKSYGFEYRTPPAGIFYTPRMLELCYKIAHNTADKWYKGVIDFVYDSLDENLKIWSDFTDEEIAEYKSLIKNYDEVKDNNVVAAWVSPDRIRKYVKEYPVTVKYSDDYGYVFCSALANELKDLRLKKKVSIRMFGLSASRGDKKCSNIDIIGFDRIDLDAGENCIGLSRDIRVTDNKGYAMAVASQIKRHIKETYECA
jgi:hypothetical protein